MEALKAVDYSGLTSAKIRAALGMTFAEYSQQTSVGLDTYESTTRKEWYEDRIVKTEKTTWVNARIRENGWRPYIVLRDDVPCVFVGTEEEMCRLGLHQTALTPEMETIEIEFNDVLDLLSVNRHIGREDRRTVIRLTGQVTERRIVELDDKIVVLPGTWNGRSLNKIEVSFLKEYELDIGELAVSEDTGIIHAKGQFKGKPLYVAWLWSAVQAGEGRVLPDKHGWFIMDLRDDDICMFPELWDKEYVLLSDNNGCVEFSFS